MKFTLTIDCDDTAYAVGDHDPDRNFRKFTKELAGHLRTATRTVVQGLLDGDIKDSNGNTVGSFELTDGITEDDSRY